MKIFRIFLCFFIILTLVSCGKNELTDLSGFITNYNNTNEADLSLSDFIIQKNSDISYTAVISEDSCDILLSLTQGSDNKIKSCKIALIKEDGSVLTKENINTYYITIINALSAYCSYDENICSEIADSLNLSSSETIMNNGELVLKKDNFCFVYYSTEIISLFTVYNTYIEEVKPTEKPVSKPYFGEDIIIKDKETP